MDRATTFISLFLTGLFFPFLLAGQGDLRFRHLGKKDGLSQNSVFTIAQDDRGVMWFGTRDGLNEFDGYRFKIHRHDTKALNSLPSNDVRSLAFDRYRNCLWVGTMDGLGRYDFASGKWWDFHHHEVDEPQLSHQVIRNIFVDSTHRVWVSTSNGLHLLEPDVSNFQQMALTSQSGMDVKLVFEDEKRLWVGTEKGLYIFEDKESLEQPLQLASDIFPELTPVSNFHLKTINLRKKGEYWFGTQANGIWCWDEKTATLSPYRNQKEKPESLSHNNIRSVAIAPDGTLWVGTFNGLNQFLPEKKSFRRILSSDFDREGLRNNSVRSVFLDAQANLWVGTYYGGVHYLNEEFSRFQVFQHQPGINSLSFDVVSSFAEAQNGDLWIGTEGGGLNYFDREHKRFRFIRAKDGLQGENVKCLLLDEETLFIGMFQNGLKVLNTETGELRHFQHQPLNPNSLSNNNVYALLKTGETLWIGTYNGGLNKMNLQTGQFSQYKNEAGNTKSLCSDWVRTLAKDADGHLWVGTDDGLSKTIHEEGEQLIFQHFLENIKVYATMFSGEKIWVGTLGQGLFSLEQQSGRTQQFTMEHGLPGNSILGILPDESGNLWLSTNNGISRFDPQAGTFTNYSHTDGLENLEFNYNAFYRTQSGEFLFGGTSGFTRFHPEDLQPSDKVPPVILTGLIANNREIEVDDESGILEKPLNETETLSFKYGDANFTLHFAALDFTNPRGNRFAYRMIGLNEDWTNVTGRPEATYTLQQDGYYTFQLKAANKDGLWNPQIRQLRIRVLPPPARTWWAYLIYITVIGLAITAIVRIVRLRQSYKLEHLEKEQQASLHQMKMRFFTNVAHEFRTPLTLIIGPLEELLQKDVTGNNSNARHRLGTIYNNAQRMLDLVNQLLTFRKMEEGHEPMQVEQTNLPDFLSNIFESFSDHAEMREITYNLNCSANSMEVWLDREKMSKVFFNLLSNAFKFTPDGGEISVNLRSTDTDAAIEVRDNGPGIDSALHEQVFQRFYEKAPGGTPRQIKGMGIGLSLSRQLVKLHHGQLELDSKPGQGSIFTVHLPLGRKQFKPEDLKSESVLDNEISAAKVPISIQPVSVESEEQNRPIDQPLLLTVEDNPEVQAYIRSIFSERYQVISAADGERGLAAAKEQQPDIILSDVMMPKMDGFELCKHLKTNLATSHIPVILLTARTTLNERLEGLKTGADDYISKPFHPDELRLKVRNRLAQRQRQREQFSQSYSFAPKEIAVSSADEEFLKLLIELVEANIENPSFNIEQFAQELAVSRALLFTKIKALTNYTPKNFLKSFRLKRAMQLLETGKLNVSEVAYRVGFKEPKYFSKVFQKEYGRNPSEFLGNKSTRV